MRRALLLSLLVFALVAPAAATHTSSVVCKPRPGATTPGTGTWQVETGSSGTYYVDDRGLVGGWGVWTYQESNGIFTRLGPGLHTGTVATHNLQRGGEGILAPFLPGDDADLCYEAWPWDQLVL